MRRSTALSILPTGVVTVMLCGMLAACVPGGVLTVRSTVKADFVEAIYIPTNRYDKYSCQQISLEIQNTSASILDISGKLERGEYDKSGGLVGGPFGGFIYDNTNFRNQTPRKAQELGLLKGTMISLREAATRAKCPMPT